MSQPAPHLTVFDYIQLSYPDLTDGLRDIYEDKLRLSELGIQRRPDIAEKVDYLNTLISSANEKLERGPIAEMYVGMLKPIDEFMLSFKLKNRLFATISENNSSHPALESLNKIAELGSSLENLTASSKEDIVHNIKTLLRQETTDPSMKDTVKTKNPALDLALRVISYHFELAYIDYLNERKKELLSVDTPNVSMEKIEWLGTQAELGELFVELRKKGWIKDFNRRTIKQSFTNAESIEQILQPGTDSKADYRDTFPKIYTKRYKPVFSEIKEYIPRPTRKGNTIK